MHVPPLPPNHSGKIGADVVGAAVVGGGDDGRIVPPQFALHPSSDECVVGGLVEANGTADGAGEVG